LETDGGGLLKTRALPIAKPTVSKHSR